jgi:predicted CopG family antitoxin
MVTTISISNEMKEKLRHLGKSGESYEDIIKKMYDLTKSNILLQYLYDESDSVSINDAISESKKRWRK